MTFRIEVFKGKKTTPYVQTLAELRLEAFCEYPYLYVGTLENELQYTQQFSLNPEGMIIVAFEGDEIAGLYSGLPLKNAVSFLADWHATLKENDIDVENCFYLGELIIKPQYQRQGLGGQLMTQMLNEAKSLGYNKVMGVTGIREPGHPLRPLNYFDADTIWGKFGLKKNDIVFTCTWPTKQPDGSVKREENKLACWMMDLS